MTTPASPESALGELSDAVGERTTDAFATLANETRLAILLALWEAIEPPPPLDATEPALPFSELYDRIPISDSGNFTYHLEQLQGLFVRETEAGYTLSTPAEHLLRTVFAGTLAVPASFTDEPVDGQCYRCGGDMVIDYSDGVLIERCTECEGLWRRRDVPPGTVLESYRPPVGLQDRSPQAFHRHSNTWLRHRLESILEDVCPDCSGPIESNLQVCSDHAAPGTDLCPSCGTPFVATTVHVCTICKLHWVAPAFVVVFTEAAVTAFLHDHGVDYAARFDASDEKAVWEHVAVMVTGETPPELAVELTYDGDHLRATIDETASVVTVDRSG